MATLFSHTDIDGDKLAVFTARISGQDYDLGMGLNIRTTFDGCSLPDAEIPNLVAALQNYMSRRAKEITNTAKEA